MLLLSVVLNEYDTEQVSLFLMTAQGELLVSESSLDEWRFRIPKTKPLQYQDQSYYPMRALPGVQYAIDYGRMSIKIMATDATAFKSNKITALSSNKLLLKPPSLGGFLNYNINAQTTNPQSQLGSIFEAGLFNRYGVGTSNFLAQHSRGRTDVGVEAISRETQLTRLNTTWTLDRPEHMNSIRFGDSYTSTGSWGQSAGFGGIQWATNFGTQPGFLTMPLPSTEGEALVPTMVDLYINNALISRHDVNSGPFSITNIPALSGHGAVNIVTKDMLGREQVVYLPYYASNDLLNPGLHQFSYELGAIRSNFGIESNNYSHLAAVGTDRFGVTERLTAEWHAEVLGAQQTVGVGASYLIGNLGVADVAVAGSHSNDLGIGQFLSLGFQRQSHGGISFGANAQWSSPEFLQIGIQSDELAPSLQTQAYVGIPLPDGTAVGITYVQQNNRGEQASTGLVSVGYNRNVGRSWTVGINGITNVRGEDSKILFLTLTWVMGERTVATVAGSFQRENNQGVIELTQNLPVGTGWGYDLYAANGQNTNYRGALSAQTEIGTYTGTVAAQDGEMGYRLEASGGLVTLGDSTHLTRTVTDSFAVVHVPDHDNIDIYADNHFVSRTNKKGYALIPNLRSYQLNEISVDETQLPLDSDIHKTTLHTAPYYRSGVLLKFPVRRSRAVTFKLVTENGDIVPAGAMLNAVGSEEEYPVGDEGIAYMSGIGEANQVRATWEEQRCEFALQYPKTKDPMPDLGTIVCKKKE